MLKKLNWLKKLDSDSPDIYTRLTGVSMKKENFLRKESRFFLKVVMSLMMLLKKNLDILNNLHKPLPWTLLKFTLTSKTGL